MKNEPLGGVKSLLGLWLMMMTGKSVHETVFTAVHYSTIAYGN